MEIFVNVVILIGAAFILVYGYLIVKLWIELRNMYKDWPKKKGGRK